MVKEIKKDNFKKEVLESKKTVVADFNANWCGPCRMLRPILDELSEKDSKTKFVSINVDDNQELAKKYGVLSIPCLILFKEGKEVDRSVGLISKSQLEKFIGE